MPSSWRRCDTCRRVLAIDDFPSPDDAATTCSQCLAPKPARKRRTTPAVTTRRAGASSPTPRKVATEPAPPPEPVPLRSMVGRGEPAARRARARAIAMEDLRDAHPTQYEELLASATAARRGPGRASTELVELHREEFEERLAAANEAEGLPRSSFG